MMLFALWLLSAIFAFGALNADTCAFVNRLYDNDKKRRGEVYREMIGLALSMSLIPALNIVWAFICTGLLQHGWSLRGPTGYAEAVA